MHYRVIAEDQMIITIIIIVIIADLYIHSFGTNIKKAGTTDITILIQECINSVYKSSYHGRQENNYFLNGTTAVCNDQYCCY